MQAYTQFIKGQINYNDKSSEMINSDDFGIPLTLGASRRLWYLVPSSGQSLNDLLKTFWSASTALCFLGITLITHILS